MPGVEMVNRPGLYASRPEFPARAKTLARGARQTSRAYMSFMQLTDFSAMPKASFSPAKMLHRNAGNRPAHMTVRQDQACVREEWMASAHSQRPNEPAAPVPDVNVGDANHGHAVIAPAIPRVVRIKRANGEPAHGAETKSCVVTKTDKEHKSRRPQRTIVGMHRSRPPAPVTTGMEPASIVIRRPAPRLIGNPGPAVVRLPDPAA